MMWKDASRKEVSGRSLLFVRTWAALDSDRSSDACLLLCHHRKQTWQSNWRKRDLWLTCSAQSHGSTTYQSRILPWMNLRPGALTTGIRTTSNHSQTTLSHSASMGVALATAWALRPTSTATWPPTWGLHIKTLLIRRLSLPSFIHRSMCSTVSVYSQHLFLGIRWMHFHFNYGISVSCMFNALPF